MTVSRVRRGGPPRPRWQLVDSMQQDKSSTRDPKALADDLVKENGLDRARQIAMEMTTSATAHDDFYQLSVWREVKRMLRDWTEAPE